MPMGLWAVFVSTLGDGTGGLLTTSPRFQVTGEPGNSLLYSLEQFMLNTTLDGGATAAMIVENMDNLPLNGSTGARSNSIQILLNDNGPALGSSCRLGAVLRKPMFLGAPVQNGLNAGLQFVMDNTAVSLAVKAEGYYWDPGAINAIGGPQRPPGSIYGG
jgi:hypothetical protein